MGEAEMDVTKIITDGTVGQIVANIAKKNPVLNCYTDDYIQDLCLLLLEPKHADRIDKMTEQESRYYIARIASNNLNSKTSRFFYLYRKNTNYLELNDKKVKDKY